MKTEPQEEVEEEEEAQSPPSQEQEVSIPFSMLCYCFFHTVQCGVRVTLLHLVRGGTLLTITVLLQIRILTYEEWMPEVMRWKVKEEVEEEEMEVIVVGGEDVEGVGRETQQGGEVHPSGGTDSSLAGVAPTLEVQHAFQHAVDISQGRALPANTTIIAPLAPPPQATSSLLPPRSRPIWGLDSGSEEGYCAGL